MQEKRGTVELGVVNHFTILEPWGLRQEDSDTGIRLGYTVRSCLSMQTTRNQNLKARTFAHSGDNYFKKENKIKSKPRKELLVKLWRNENAAHHCLVMERETVLRNARTGEGLYPACLKP